MSNEMFVALLDEAYDFITRDYLERMLETTVSVLNEGRLKMNLNYDDLEDADFKQFATKMYRAWLTGGKKALAAANEKCEQTEGENE